MGEVPRTGKGAPSETKVPPQLQTSKWENHTVSGTPPKGIGSNPVYKERLPLDILKDIQADKKKGLSQAQEHAGAVKGFFLFIFYAIKIATGWKIPDEGKSPEEGKMTRASVSSEQIMGTELETLKKPEESRDGDLEKKFKNLQPNLFRKVDQNAVGDFLFSVGDRKHRVSREEDPARWEKLDQMGREAANLILDSKTGELKEADRSKMSPRELVAHCRAIGSEQKRLGEIEMKGIGALHFEDVRGSEVQALSKLKEGVYKEFESRFSELSSNELFFVFQEMESLPLVESEEKAFSEFKEQVEKEYEQRAETERQKVQDLIPEEAKSAEKELVQLQSNLKELVRNEEGKAQTEKREKEELERLVKREQTVKKELQEERILLSKQQKQFVDPAVDKAQKHIEETREVINSIKSNLKRLKELEDKIIRIKNGDLPREGSWKPFGERDPLSSAETKEYYELLDKQVGMVQDIDIMEKGLKEAISQMTDEQAKLIKEHLEAIERRIQSLEEESVELPGRIEAQKRVSEAASREALAAFSKANKTRKSIEEHERTLKNLTDNRELMAAVGSFMRSVAYREGIKVPGWNPNQVIIPKETTASLKRELSALPLPPIEFPNVFGDSFGPSLRR